MLQAPAWRSLSGAAVKVFLEVRCRFHGANNGSLSLSLEQAADLLGLGKATVHCAFKELQDKGFVVCTRRGQMVRPAGILVGGYRQRHRRIAAD